MLNVFLFSRVYYKITNKWIILHSINYVFRLSSKFAGSVVFSNVIIYFKSK